MFALVKPDTAQSVFVLLGCSLSRPAESVSILLDCISLPAYCCRCNQETLYRLAEAGWQLSKMYSRDLCLLAGTDGFHPCWPLPTEEVVQPRERIEAIEDPALKSFQLDYLERILKKRKAYHKAYLKSNDPNHFRQDMKRRALNIKTSVVSYI